MTNELNSIFDGYARIRDLSGDADVATIEALPDDHRAKLFECIAACAVRDEGSDRVVAARKAVRIKETAFNEASLAYSGVVQSRDSVTGVVDYTNKLMIEKGPAMRAAQEKISARMFELLGLTPGRHHDATLAPSMPSKVAAPVT